MNTEALKTQTKEEVLSFIRKRLSFDKKIQSQLRKVDENEFASEHRRFNMTGYESQKGECTLSNLAIVNEFADLGIYDYTNYLFLDFYKGVGTLYFQYFGEDQNQTLELAGCGTTEIIYTIFKKTIFSNKSTRRRS